MKGDLVKSPFLFCHFGLCLELFPLCRLFRMMLKGRGPLLCGCNTTNAGASAEDDVALTAPDVGREGTCADNQRNTYRMFLTEVMCRVC